MTAASLLLGLAAAVAQGMTGDWVLTVDGLGPVRIGMTQAQVAQALGTKLEGEAIESDDICVEKASPRLKGVYFMFEERKLTRISIGDDSRVRTPRGIGVGASAAEVRRKYPKPLQAEPHHYLDLPGEYLTYWTVPKRRGVRFETDLKRRVQTIHAGGPSIQYVEGCA